MSVSGDFSLASNRFAWAMAETAGWPRVFGMSVKAVAKGRQQLLSGEVDPARIRKPGGGRKSVEKKNGTVIDLIIELMEHDTAGCPISGRLWTRTTTEKVARELKAWGISICDRTVAHLLKGLGYALRVNQKTVSGR